MHDTPQTQQTPDQTPDVKHPECDCAARLIALETRVKDLEEKNALSARAFAEPFASGPEQTDYTDRFLANIHQTNIKIDQARKEISKFEIPVFPQHHQSAFNRILSKLRGVSQ